MNTNTETDSKETAVVISDLLTVLLQFSKTEFLKQPDNASQMAAVKQALGPLYSFDMKAVDVLRVVHTAYREFLAEPRFEAHRTDSDFRLLMAPIEKTRTETLFTKEAFDFDNIQRSMIDICYSYIHHMLSEMMLSNIGWCRDTVFKPEGQDAKSN